ncbi:ribonuclease N [Amycolatopsis antarctica]|uniref:Ribonuclease N n=1 Tax=Amycolatopsis antarctica TaxID=1854586 RepID=A0A263D9X3_9PSEU|nr:ribonuclease domain-containing protein [Amycolatopsis antarctica]OZM74276.1 ribonuclease N [Amycolatopsis antarctica]
MLSRRRITAALVGLVILVFAGWLAKDVLGDDTASGTEVPGADSGLTVQTLSSLPPEAADTWELIRSQGPFPYPGRDGTVFGNREGILPPEESGYYREYTVPTPQSRDRGARRLVAGSSSELYYTGDHYDSFVVVDPNG